MAYIFIRGEYMLAAASDWHKAIAEAYAAGLSGQNILGSDFASGNVFCT